MRITSLLLTLISISIVISSVAEGSDWIYLMETQAGVYYYDRQSINSISNNIWKGWTKQVVLTKEQRDWNIIILEKLNLSTKGYEDLSYGLDLWEINCSTEQMRLVSFAAYNTQHMSIYSGNVEEKWSHVIPESTGDTLYNIVCKLTNI
jgi:hypothetical protein